MSYAGGSRCEQAMSMAHVLAMLVAHGVDGPCCFPAFGPVRGPLSGSHISGPRFAMLVAHVVKTPCGWLAFGHGGGTYNQEALVTAACVREYRTRSTRTTMSTQVLPDKDPGGHERR